MSRSTENNLHAASANSAAAVADASAGYFAHSASESLKPVPGGVGCPPGYKQTEVGVIPEDWEVVDIRYLNPFITSGSRGWAEFYSEYGDSFVRITNMDRASIYLDTSDMRYVQIPSNSTEGKRTSLQNGDVLVSITADIGICSYVDDSLIKPAYINQHIALVRFDPEITNSKYISYFLASEQVQKLFRGASDQGAKAGMNLESVRRLQVVLPDKNEQTAIANALSDVDSLISELEKLISKKQAIKTATMQQLLTGCSRLPQFSLREDGTQKGNKPSELGEIPEDWECIALGDLCSLKSGLGITSEDIDDSSEYRCFGGNGLRGYTKQFTHEGEYALIGRQGALCGNTQYVRGKFFASEHALVATPRHGVDSRWLAIYLERMNLNQYSESSAQPGLSAEKLRLLDVITPTSKEQTTIALILSDMVEEIQMLEQRLSKTRQIKQGMMQELLTGRTRLV